MKAYENQPEQAVPLETLKHWRDQLAERIARLCAEPMANVVEGFEYLDERKARRVRGRLLCSALRRIDFINAAICEKIAPTFAVRPSEGWSDRVMSEIRRAPVAVVGGGR